MLPKILFVDDEINILNSIKRGLQDEPYNCLFASSPKSAFDLLKTDGHDVSVIVSDQRMPQMDGDDFVSIIRMHYPHIVCMILTGYASIESAIKSVNEGEIFRYLTKPVDMKDLNLAIKEAITYQKSVSGERLKNNQKNIDANIEYQLEKDYPGITKVNKNEDGSIDIEPD